MIFLAGGDKARFGTLIEDLNNSYLAGNDQYPVLLDGTLTSLLHYQGHRGGEHMDGNKNVSRETTFAQRKPRKAQQLARIRCWNCNEYGHCQSDCPQKKEMHGTQISEVVEDENEDGIASARSCQDGTAST
jgi:radical SAM protein with 4Fe4S-binding SPASM domain